MTTKQKIFYEALSLFSISGFEGVSMRDIAAAVGIRESGIYKHYLNKQAILDEIVENAGKEIDSLFISLNVPTLDNSIDRYTEMEIEDVAKLCTSMLIKQIENDIISKFRRLLTIEQYRNKYLRKIYVEVFMERQLGYIEKVFQYLLERNILQGISPKVMALEFFAPFFMMQYKVVNNREMLEEMLMEHAICFIREHLKGE